MNMGRTVQVCGIGAVNDYLQMVNTIPGGDVSKIIAQQLL